MSSDDVVLATPADDKDINPLVFWAAYMEGPNEKKNYLGDGKGNVRLFKSESALRTFIKPLISVDDYSRMIVHPVEGKFALPEELPARADAPILLSPPAVNGIPIKTLAPMTFPTAAELLENEKKRRKRRRRS